MGITTFYVVKGGMFSVVITEVMQFCILSVASIAIGIIAMAQVAPELLRHAVPAGWDQIFFGWHLNLDWSGLIAAVNAKIAADGYSIFGAFFMMMLFKGILISAAGPAPNYDMQRILSTQQPARSFHDERHGERGAERAALLHDHRPDHSGAGLLQR